MKIKIQTYNSRLGILLMGFLLLISISCEEFVSVDLPDAQLTGTMVFQEESTATAALSDIYASMASQGFVSGGQFGASFLWGMYTDELDYYGSDIDTQGWYQHTILPSNDDVNMWWRTAYSQVYQLNAFLEGVSASQSLSQAYKDQVRGEALVLRAMLYWYAQLCWGAIPYVNTTDYQVNAQITRTDKESVLALLQTDLLEAISLLAEAYTSTSRIRVNRYAAMALLSRIYLETEQWQLLMDRTSDIIEATLLYSWETDLTQVFLIENPGTIWQFNAGVDGRNTQEGALYVLHAAPPTIVAMNTEFYTSFGESDLRRINWIGSISDAQTGTTYYYPFKYQQSSVTDTSLEYSKVFRLAEIYLMRAEAAAHLGALEQAKNDLNQVHERAGLDVVSSTDTETLLELIWEERRWELFSEGGLRWFDLKRLGLATEVLAPVKSNWTENDILFPIPETELVLNPNLAPQNTGY